MEIIKTIAYILAVILLCIAWFIAFALGYMLQGEWACVPCIAVNFVFGIALVELIGGSGGTGEEKDGGREMIQNDYMYNQNFRKFVDTYCQENGVDVKEALEHEDVKHAWRHYTEV